MSGRNEGMVALVTGASQGGSGTGLAVRLAAEGAKIGISARSEEGLEKTRKLIVGTSRPDVRLVLVRASDVPTYVQYGGADLGVVGKDTLLELLATLERTTILLSPDSGPAHMATAVGTPVLGLYAATNPLRSGPYLSRQLCVDKYDAAARALLGKPASEIPWTTKIEREGVMDLITPDDVIKKLQSFMTQRGRRKS